MFQKLGDALRRFMAGCYGTDKLNMAILAAALVRDADRRARRQIPDAVAGDSTYLSEALLIWSIFRTYSRNIEARRRENMRWLGFCSRIKDRRNRYFRCPRCRQMVRVPRGKGTINIRCPKCGERFIKKT